MSGLADIERALAGLASEARGLLPRGVELVDGHAHLGDDVDGHSLRPRALLALLDEAGIARTVAFAMHDPSRKPAYRAPNDRVLAWARESGGRILPLCRLDPGDGALDEARRCLDAGARGLKLHPHSDGFTFRHPAIGGLFDLAESARVPVVIHTGIGSPSIIDGLCEHLDAHPKILAVLAHAGIADQGRFATRLRAHPGVCFDTSWISPFDLHDLMARVPVERLVFATDAPYNRPAAGLCMAAHLAAHAGLDADAMRGLFGGTLLRLLDGKDLPPTTPPRAPPLVTFDGRRARLCATLLMALGDGLSRAPEVTRHMVEAAQVLCADPEPGPSGHVLARVGALLALAEPAVGSVEALRSHGTPLLIAAAGLAAFG